MTHDTQPSSSQPQPSTSTTPSQASRLTVTDTTGTSDAGTATGRRLSGSGLHHHLHVHQHSVLSIPTSTSSSTVFSSTAVTNTNSNTVPSTSISLLSTSIGRSSISTTGAGVPVPMKHGTKNVPYRSTKTTQKLVLFPDDDVDVGGDGVGGNGMTGDGGIVVSGTGGVNGLSTQVSDVSIETSSISVPDTDHHQQTLQPTQNQYPLQGQLKPTTTHAERLNKPDRYMYPRVTCYCISDTIRLDSVCRYLRVSHGVNVKRVDECVYVVYDDDDRVRVFDDTRRRRKRVDDDDGDTVTRRLVVVNDDGGDRVSSSWTHDTSVRRPQSDHDNGKRLSMDDTCLNEYTKRGMNQYDGVHDEDEMDMNRHLVRRVSDTDDDDDGHVDNDDHVDEVEEEGDGGVVVDGNEDGDLTPRPTRSRVLDGVAGVHLPDTMMNPSSDTHYDYEEEEDTPSINVHQKKPDAVRDGDEPVIRDWMLRGEVFVFDYGVITLWNFSEHEEQMFLMMMSVFCHGLYNVDDVEVEDFHFQYDVGGPVQPRIYNDMITLKSGNPMIKMTISHGMAQSAKLTVFENRMEETMDDTTPLVRMMAMKGEVELGKSDVMRKVGELFQLRMDVNLVSNVLDTPEIFWVEPDYEGLYNAIRGYLEITQRVTVLNTRGTVLSDLMQMLSDHQNVKDSNHIMWIIIVFIVAAVGVAVAEMVIKRSR